MSKLSSRVMSSGLFTLLAVGAVGSAIGCSKPEEEKKKQAWSCTRDEVPMGEVVRCTSSAMTADGPIGGTTGGTADGTTQDGTTTNGATADGTTGDGDDTTTYECGPGADGPDCPPADTTGATTDETTTSGDTTSGEESPPSNGTEGATSKGGAPGNGGASGNGGGHKTDGTGAGNSSSGGSGGGSSHERGCDECAYVPDLDYCGGSGSGSADGTSSSGTTSAGTDCGKPNCSPPGQDKKGSTTGGTGASSSGGGSDGASSGGSGASSGGEEGTHYTCKKDKKGNKSCVSTPDCAPGTHPSACGACVSDSDGTADCVPPSEGGCWITGGGFIVGASLVPAAAADGHDNFGGNAKPMKKGNVSGHWNHVDHGTGNHAKGRPEYIMCRVTDGPGPKQPGGKKGMVVNQVYFGGHAQWREAATATWSDGYWFDVVAEDHGEPGNTSALKNGAMPDSYHFTIRKIDDAGLGVSGAVVYETRDDLRGGNIQIHPSNNGHPATTSPLPAWVSIEQ